MRGIFIILPILFTFSIFAQQPMFEEDEWQYRNKLTSEIYDEKVTELFLWNAQPYVQVETERPFYLPIFDMVFDGYHIQFTEYEGPLLMSQFGLVPIATLRPFDISISNETYSTTIEVSEIELTDSIPETTPHGLIQLCTSTTCEGIENGLKTKTVSEHDYLFIHKPSNYFLSYYANYLISSLGNNNTYTLQFQTMEFHFISDEINIDFLHRADNLIPDFNDVAMDLTYSKNHPNPILIKQTVPIPIGTLRLNDEIIEYELVVDENSDENGLPNQLISNLIILSVIHILLRRSQNRY